MLIKSFLLSCPGHLHRISHSRCTTKQNSLQSSKEYWSVLHDEICRVIWGRALWWAEQGRAMLLVWYACIGGVSNCDILGAVIALSLRWRDCLVTWWGLCCAHTWKQIQAGLRTLKIVSPDFPKLLTHKRHSSRTTGPIIIQKQSETGTAKCLRMTEDVKKTNDKSFKNKRVVSVILVWTRC